MPIRLYALDEEPERIRLLPSDEPERIRLFPADDEEEDTRSTWEKLRDAAKRGVVGGVADIAETVGGLSALPTRVGLTEQEGERPGWDAPTQWAERVRAGLPAKPEGAGYAAAEIAASLPTTVAKYAPTLLAGGPLGAAAIMGAEDFLSEYGKGATLSEAAGRGALSAGTGAVLGKLGAAGALKRVLGGAGVGAGAAALEGGDAEDIVAGAAAMGTLGGLLKTPRRAEGAPATTNVKREIAKITGKEQAAVELPTVMSRAEVEAALLRGEPVRPEVLKEYPDLAKPSAITGKPPERPLNFERWQTTDDVKYDVAQRLERNRAAVEADAVPVSWESVRRESLAKGYTLDELAARLPDAREAKVRVMTAEQLAVTNAERTNALKGQLDDAVGRGANPKEMQVLQDDLKASEAASTASMLTALGYESEAGRALNILKVMRRAYTPGEQITRRLARAGKLSDDVASKLMALPTEDIQGRLNIMRAAFKPSVGSKLYEVWINGLLSSPMTHAVNATSNAVTQAVRAAERPVAAALELRKGGERERFFTETMADLQGFIHSLPKALVAFNEARRGNAVSRTKIEHPSALPETIAGVPTPTTMLVASDEAFKAVAATREAYVQAYRRARLEGKGRAEAFDEIPRILGDLTRSKNILKDMRAAQEVNHLKRLTGQGVDEYGELVGKALQAAEYQTFTTEGGAAVKGVIGLKESGGALGTALRLFVPFVQTPANIAKMSYQHTPAYLLELAGKKGQAMSSGEMSDELAKVTLGGLFSGLVAWMAAEGMVTGNAPDDPEERSNWLAQGKQPYSVKVGDRYISFQRIEPLATLAGLAADSVKLAQRGERPKVEDMIRVVSDNFTDKTFMQGLENLAMLWQEPSRYGERVAKSLVGSVVPSGVAAVARGIDPVLREAPMKEIATAGPDALNVLKARVPGLSKTLPARIDVTGEPVERSDAKGVLGMPAGLSRTVSPFQTTQERPEAVLQREFEAVGYVPSKAKRRMTLKTLGGDVPIELTREEIDQLDASDRAAAEYLRPMVTDPEWQTMEPAARERIIKTVYRKFRARSLASIRGGRLAAFDYEE